MTRRRPNPPDPELRVDDDPAGIDPTTIWIHQGRMALFLTPAQAHALAARIVAEVPEQ